MEYRLVREHEMKEAALLAEEVFCKDKERYMEYSFPTLFRPGVSQSYAAFNDQGKLVSFIGMVPFIIHSDNVRLYSYSIGAVCTDPAYRGQGLAGELFTLCQQHAKEAGASLMFISGDRSLYTRAGSVTFGKSKKYTLEATIAEKLNTHTSQWTFSEFEPKDMFAVHSLMLDKSSAIQWSLAELAQFIGASPMANIHNMNQRIHVARTPEQVIVAVAVFAVPRIPSPDNVGMLIEYAGLPSAVIGLLSNALTQFELTSLSLTIPWQDVELANLLQAVDASVERQNNIGTVLVIDGEALIAQSGYRKSATNNIAISVLSDGRYELHTPHGSSFIDGNPELVSLLFDPDSSVEYPADARLQPIALPYMYGLYFI
ncbi:GNAT family N-acetyltransferase [Paenibacillus glacialis]|uniref:N-acetyltransferase domain-containing protein n=1 Tax=Paenibacillus glacialis TaxID=494026 RepID=A0A168N2D9_9BACL|nr:GNAT family N-acetyltransferase [Paenibacillus glacialis]OAB45312.1 hypothetical protein PGLA_03395 [Paenibacillus glacialis]